MVGRERRDPRRLEFPGASPEMEFLRLDDDKPDDVLSGWEPFFTGKETSEEGARVAVKRGFYDYYPVKEIKAGATIVARYVEPQAAENTFDKKDPPYIVTFKYGQGWTAFLGSSEVWRFNQYKSVFFQRFWVKMSRFLSSGSRKRQNVRGRILMSKEFSIGDYLRVTGHALDASLKGVPASSPPEIILRPVELDSYAGMNDGKKKDAPPSPKKDDGDPDKLTREKEDYHKRLTRVYKMSPRKGQDQSEEGYFEFKKLLTAKEFPTGVWRVEMPIPNSSESIPQKFLIRKAPPLELADTAPDFLALAAISSEVDELKSRLESMRKSNVYERLNSRAFQAPGLGKPRMMYKFDDKQSIELLPECFKENKTEIENPQIEPEYRKTKIKPLWFDGPDMPRWMTSWYDSMMGESEKTHSVAIWMLVCIGLLSVEWLTRKLLKLA
jgi:hypothetical protein